MSTIKDITGDRPSAAASVGSVRDKLNASRWSRPLFIFVFGLILIIQCFTLVWGALLGSQGVADFKHLYVAGYMVRTGKSAAIYDYSVSAHLQQSLVYSGTTPLPFNHLSYESLIFLPFSLFGYRAAYFAFFIFNLLVYVTAYFLYVRPTGKMKPALSKAMTGLLFASFLPLALALIQGQDSILLLFALLCSYLALEREHDFLAGSALALGLFKFQFVVPIAVMYLLWKKFRFIAGFCTTAAILLPFSVWIVGLRSWNSYLSDLLSMSTNLNEARQNAFGIWPRVMVNLRGILDLAVDRYLSHWALQAIIFSVSILLLLWAARRRPSFSLAVTVGLMVSYHAGTHDALILLLPILLTADDFLSASSYWRLSTTALLFVCPVVLMLAGLPPCLLAVAIFFFLAAVATSSEGRMRADVLRGSATPGSTHTRGEIRISEAIGS